MWVRSFDTIEELRLALLEFKRTTGSSHPFVIDGILPPLALQAPRLVLERLRHVLCHLGVLGRVRGVSVQPVIVRLLANVGLQGGLLDRAVLAEGLQKDGLALPSALSRLGPCLFGDVYVYV